MTPLEALELARKTWPDLGVDETIKAARSLIEFLSPPPAAKTRPYNNNSWTPERRAAQAERMRETMKGRWDKAASEPPAPLKVGNLPAAPTKQQPPQRINDIKQIAAAIEAGKVRKVSDGHALGARTNSIEDALRS